MGKSSDFAIRVQNAEQGEAAWKEKALALESELLAARKRIAELELSIAHIGARLFSLVNTLERGIANGNGKE